MEDRTIHPSIKGVMAVDLLASAITIGGIYAIYRYADNPPGWAYAIPAIILIWPVILHLKRLTVTLRFRDDHLTLETGLFSRTRRTVDTAKIQDVTVQQSFGQRLMSVGDLRFEDSGAGGGMVISGVDNPRELADLIINSSKRSR